MLNQRTASLHRHALDEINYYRRLLQLSPLPRIEAFSASQSGDQATERSSSTSLSFTPTVSAAATLESMPREILDRIAAFMNGRTIWRLSHAVPYYKYISSAMLDVMKCTNGPRQAQRLWPVLEWHVGRPGRSAFPISHIHLPHARSFQVLQELIHLCQFAKGLLKSNLVQISTLREQHATAFVRGTKSQHRKLWNTMNNALNFHWDRSHGSDCFDAYIWQILRHSLQESCILWILADIMERMNDSLGV
ncbi:hypothetical protein HDU81_002484 [Chytriomyces hyalinus]|nr:hypothetical protein HDU81_002484 [Chytriomyces hyalinus]